MPKRISAANVPINENGRFVDDVNFLSKVNLSRITTKSQYWQGSKQKNKCKKLENKINNFGNTILALKSKTWGDHYREQLKKEFKELKNSMISVQKAAKLSALQNQEDVLATKNLNRKLENIMKEIHKSEDFLAKTKSYKAFDTAPEKKKEELEIFRKLDSELQKIEKRSTNLKEKFEKSIEAIRPFKVILSLINRFKSLLLSADDELTQREDSFKEVARKIEAQLIEFGKKIGSIENPSLLRSFVYAVKDVNTSLLTSLKSAEKLGLLVDDEITVLKNKITEMTNSFNKRMEILEENAIKKKEQEHKEKITYLKNWKCPGSSTSDSKTAFPYWEDQYRNATFIHVETLIHECGKELNQETSSAELSKYQKNAILTLEETLNSVTSVNNVSKIENIEQIEASLKLAKELKKAIDTISPSHYSTFNEIRLKEFKQRMLVLKKGIETINHLPEITDKETFNFQKANDKWVDLITDAYADPNKTDNYVKETKIMLKKAYRYLKKLNKSYATLNEANIDKITTNPVILKQLESKLALLDEKFTIKENLGANLLILYLEPDFKKLHLSWKDRAELSNSRRKLEVLSKNLTISLEQAKKLNKSLLTSNKSA